MQPFSFKFEAWVIPSHTITMINIWTNKDKQVFYQSDMSILSFFCSRSFSFYNRKRLKKKNIIKNIRGETFSPLFYREIFSLPHVVRM